MVKLSQLLQPEVIAALREVDYEIVKYGEVPFWMERVESIPAELYRMKRIEP